MKTKNHPFGDTLEAIIYPFLITLILWIIQWVDHITQGEFYKYGLLPRSVEGIKGIFFMPLIHSSQDLNHLINNSFAFFLLFAMLVYYYRDVALKIFIGIWIFSVIFVWLYAENRGAYHIGISGVIYGLLGFLFTSGVLRKYLPLQAISLFIIFIYGNMIWGIFPVSPQVSWEGHFMGLLVGCVLAFIYRKEAVQAPKYNYEIAKEKGIEIPDFEAIYNQKLEEQKRIEMEQARQTQGYYIVYHYVPNDPPKTINPSTDDNDELK